MPGRQSKSVPVQRNQSAAADPNAAPAGPITPLIKWMAAGIAAILLLWLLTSQPSEADNGPAGTVAAFDQTPMTREQALAILKQTRESALVETQAEEVFVSFAAASFPLETEGQVALVRRYVRADEVVEGRKRRIYFYGPSGKKIAQSDAVTGITLMQ